MANALMPEEFFETVAPHHPPEQPVGPKGGRPRVGHRVIWFVLATGARREDVPAELGCSGRTAHRRLQVWEEAGIWDRLRADLLAARSGPASSPSTGRGHDPGGAGGRADGVTGLLLHRPLGLGRRHPDVDSRPVIAGDRLPRLQGGRRGGPAAGAVRVGQRRGVPRLPVDVHDDRGLGVGSGCGRVGGPHGLAMGQPRRARVTRTSAGRGDGAPGRGDSSRSTARGDRSGYSGGRR